MVLALVGVVILCYYRSELGLNDLRINDSLFCCLRDPLYLGLCANCLDSHKNRKH